MGPFLIISLLLAVLSPAGPAWGHDVPDPGEYGEAQSWPERFGRWIDWQQHRLSHGVILSADEFDRYLASEDPLENPVNESLIRLQLQQGFGDEGERKLEVNLRAKLRLPRLKERFRVTFESDTEDLDPLVERERGTAGGSSSASKLTDTSVLGLELEEEGRRWRQRYSVGMHLRFPLDPFVRTSWIRDFEPGGLWRGRFTESLAYFHVQGFKLQSRLDFLRPLGDSWRFHSRSIAEFVDEGEHWEWLQSLGLKQRWSERSTIGYEVGIAGDSRPDWQKTDYWLRTEFRHRLHENWLYGVIAPELLFERDNDFHGEPFIWFRLQVYFGHLD